mmetsp:Transcript_41451/g.103216  ORF Transcript_41451/g.103216 Transcript_41451/m.103216 type:complete len:553 (+) Transcript_41451:62-1720(+)
MIDPSHGLLLGDTPHTLQRLPCEPFVSPMFTSKWRAECPCTDCWPMGCGRSALSLTPTHSTRPTGVPHAPSNLEGIRAVVPDARVCTNVHRPVHAARQQVDERRECARVRVWLLRVHERCAHIRDARRRESHRKAHVGKAQLVALAEAHVLVEPVAQQALAGGGAQVGQQERALDAAGPKLPAGVGALLLLVAAPLRVHGLAKGLPRAAELIDDPLVLLVDRVASKVLRRREYGVAIAEVSPRRNERVGVQSQLAVHPQAKLGMREEPVQQQLGHARVAPVVGAVRQRIARKLHEAPRADVKGARAGRGVLQPDAVALQAAAPEAHLIEEGEPAPLGLRRLLDGLLQLVTAAEDRGHDDYNAAARLGLERGHDLIERGRRKKAAVERAAASAQRLPPPAFALRSLEACCCGATSMGARVARSESQSRRAAAPSGKLIPRGGRAHGRQDLLPPLLVRRTCCWWSVCRFHIRTAQRRGEVQRENLEALIHERRLRRPARGRCAVRARDCVLGGVHPRPRVERRGVQGEDERLERRQEGIRDAHCRQGAGPEGSA